MQFIRSARFAFVLAATGLVTSSVLAQVADRERVTPEQEWSDRLWETASRGSEDNLRDMLDRFPQSGADNHPALAGTVSALIEGLAERETARSSEMEEISGELDDLLAGVETDIDLSDALRSAVSLYMLATDKGSFMREGRIIDLIARSDRAARAAEARADWLIANELYFRLNVLLESSRRYEKDVTRLARRLGMLRLYVPERLWELRNERRLAEDLEPLPPYNSTKDGYDTKLEGVSDDSVMQAIYRAAVAHVEETDLRDILVGGLESVRTMIETPDLEGTFDGLASESDVNEMIRYLEREIGLLQQRQSIRDREVPREIRSTLSDLLQKNRATVNLPQAAILHEFGTGAMDELDQFSSIIWPDEVRRFERSTQGSFVGVGIQIQLDELQNIKVVTPLEGTPAQRAGVRAGDIIRRIDGSSTLGFTLDQAVEVITGKAGTSVTLTMERDVDDEAVEIDFLIPRKKIDLRSVKGWKRLTANEDEWEWFIDRDSGIGYLRLTDFSEDTSNELDAAIVDMKRTGLQGVVLDLRYNPGGLLDQAVEVANRFIPTNGKIVTTETKVDPEYQVERGRARKASLADTPLVVLINEGSASASEIVSGAIQDYAERGMIDALVVGRRSFGKGSVQNVWPLQGRRSYVKLTTQYYRLPAGRLIHKKPGASEWGVAPNLDVEMLPSQESKAILLRRDADVLPLDENGELLVLDEERADPEDLISEGIDLQLQTALVLLQSKAEPTSPGAQTRRN